MRTFNDIEKLIEEGGSRMLELKKSTGELKDAMHTACAFLNSDGGTLVFGANPSQKIVVQEVTDATQRKFAQAVKGIESTVDVRIEYPQEALREALINALCHRNYNNIYAAISLTICDDRVEIINQGTLPPDLSIEKLKRPHASLPHNLLIAQILFKTTFIESWGSGVRRMTGACVENGVKEPSFSLQENNFAITFYRDSKRLENAAQSAAENHSDNLDSLQKNVTENRLFYILNAIRKNNKITISELAKMLGVTIMTIRRDIDKLKQKGLITRIGPDKGGYWQIT